MALNSRAKASSAVVAAAGTVYRVSGGAAWLRNCWRFAPRWHNKEASAGGTAAGTATVLVVAYRIRIILERSISSSSASSLPP
eukprot:529688-Rhodomonas_salina.1